MAGVKTATKLVKNGFFPVFKDKNVNIEDLRTWIYLKLNFECDRTLNWNRFNYYGYLDRCDSGVVSFSYAAYFVNRKKYALKADTSFEDRLRRVRSSDYSLHLWLSSEIERERIENVLHVKSNFISKHVVQQMAVRVSHRDPESCVTLADRDRIESRRGRKQEINDKLPKVIHFSNIEIIDHTKCDLRLRVSCEPFFFKTSFANDLAQKLNVERIEALELKREKQATIDEKMCLKEYEISVEKVNAKIEELREKYL